MDNQSKATFLVIAFLSLLGVLVTVVSILVLAGGKFYHKIPEKLRPRRWFVGIFFSYFVTFCVWFPAWFFYPHSVISYALSFIFGAFTVLIGVWCGLGKAVGILLPIILPIIALVERTVGAFRDRSEVRKP
jgi:hypothetical protein